MIKDKKAYNIVDSSVIAPLIDKFYRKTRDEVSAICYALSALKGTFGLWIYNEKSANTYLARSGSTLYADFLSNNFSSVNNGKLVSLEEGLLYLLTKEGITSVGKFNVGSPFFSA